MGHDRHPSVGQWFLVVSSLSAVSSLSRAVSPAVKESSPAHQTTDKSDPVQRPSPVRSSPDVVTDAARARVTALEAAISALGTADGAASKSLKEALHKAKQFAHVPPVGERLDACHQFHRACQEALRQSRRGFVEASNRARLVGHRVGRRASPIRSTAHGSRSSAHHSSSTEGSGFKIAEDAGGDRRASAGTIRVHGRTPRKIPMEDDGGVTIGTHGSVDRRSRKQTTSCGGWVEFCMPDKV